MEEPERRRWALLILVALHISTKDDVGKKIVFAEAVASGPHRLIVWSRRPRFVGIFSAYAFSTGAELFLRWVSRAPLKVQHKRGAGRRRIGRARPHARPRLASFHVLGRNLRRIVSHALETDGDTRRSARSQPEAEFQDSGAGESRPNWEATRRWHLLRACRRPRRTALKLKPLAVELKVAELTEADIVGAQTTQIAARSRFVSAHLCLLLGAGASIDVDIVARDGQRFGAVSGVGAPPRVPHDGYRSASASNTPQQVEVKERYGSAELMRSRVTLREYDQLFWNVHRAYFSGSVPRCEQS